jgi:hypothetical protein
VLAGDVVGYWLRTSPGARPLAIHAAWRTDPDTGLAEAPVRARARLGMVVSAGALYPWRQVPRAGCPGRLRRAAGRSARWRSDGR